MGRTQQNTGTFCNCLAWYFKTSLEIQIQALFNLKMFLIVLACLAFAGCAEHAIEEELPLLSQAPRKAERF